MTSHPLAPQPTRTSRKLGCGRTTPPTSEEENEHHDGEGYGGGCDDEPSLGSLDGRMSQLRWSEPDRPVRWPNQDFELDEAEQEVGIEDLPHDPEVGS